MQNVMLLGQSRTPVPTLRVVVSADPYKLHRYPHIKVFEGKGCGGRKTFFKKFPSPDILTYIIFYS